jgi:hypothetical protein
MESPYDEELGCQPTCLGHPVRMRRPEQGEAVPLLGPHHEGPRPVEGKKHDGSHSDQSPGAAARMLRMRSTCGTHLAHFR